MHDIDVKRCDYCSKSFPTLGDLSTHQKNPAYNGCEFCDRKFCSDREYSLHLIVKHHVNPRKCKICQKEYKSVSSLKKHRLNAAPEQCDECDSVFCHKKELDFHKQKKHYGGGAPTEDPEWESILNAVVYSGTPYEKDPLYQETIEDNQGHIKDKVKENAGLYIKINKEITPAFTYRDLYEMVKKVVNKHGKSCRINIGFGIMLRHKLTEQYRYYYVLRIDKQSPS